jgi:hypothetical protein
MEAWRQWLLGGKEVFSAKIKNTHYEPRIPLTPTGLLMEGAFTLNGNFNGQVNGAFSMTVQSGSPAGNKLTLTGTVHGNSITGQWVLTGSSGCTGTGTFTMTKV